MSSGHKQCRWCAFIDFAALIQGSLEVDAVGHEVCCETRVVDCPLFIPGDVSITCSSLSLSARFGGVIVNF